MFQREFLAEAPLAFTPDWFRELELLLYSLVKLATLVAPEGTNLELRLDLSCSRHCALNRHDLAQVNCLHVADRMNRGQIVDANLVPFRVSDDMALISQELSESLAHVWLEPDILALETVDELGILPASVATKVGKVDIHCSLFFNFKLLSNLHVVLDQLNRTSSINTAV